MNLNLRGSVVLINLFLSLFVDNYKTYLHDQQKGRIQSGLKMDNYINQVRCD